MHLVAIGGSDAGISAALRARELDPAADITVVVADAFPNFSICGIPYLVSGDVAEWSDLAHRTSADLEAAGISLRLETVATRIDPSTKRCHVSDREGDEAIAYDALVIATGARPAPPPIDGLTGHDALGPADGVHLLHSMGDTFSLLASLERGPRHAVIVGAGYIGLEMAEGLRARGIAVTILERLGEVMPTVDVELGALVHAELEAHGVDVRTGTTVHAVRRQTGQNALTVEGVDDDGAPVVREADVVLVVTGVRPETNLGLAAGISAGAGGALVVDREMRTGAPGLFAAGDCVVTHHRLLGDTYAPLGTTAHKQGRIAGENALGGHRAFEGSLGTQVVKVFDRVVARTGLRDAEASAAGLSPRTIAAVADDHKAYYPGATPIAMRYTGDAVTGRLLGLQLVGHVGAEVAKRIDVAATAIYCGLAVDAVCDLDLSYTPPLGSPWDALQLGAQAWSAAGRPTESPGARRSAAPERHTSV